MKMLPEQLATLALGALMIAPILAAPVMRGEAVEHRLVGVACGPDRITTTAAEEDEFPGTCDAIGLPVEFGCNADDTATQCADYLGRYGW
jgi:hypothetical protein